jgi:hypothetical protein
VALVVLIGAIAFSSRKSASITSQVAASSHA